jgi:TonB family protein
MKGSTGMRSRRFYSAIVLAFLTAQSLAFGQKPLYSPGETHLLILIREAGYPYIESHDGEKKSWRIEQDGKNLKKIPVILSIEEYNLKLCAVLSDANRIKPGPGLNQKMKELEERVRPTSLVTSDDDHLLAELKTPIADVDLNKLKFLVGLMRKTADEAYPEFKPFLGARREPERSVLGPPMPMPEPLLVPPTHLPLPPEQVPAVDSKPVLLNRVKPDYTEEARRDNVQGVVILRVIVDVRGNVESARVVQGLPDGLNEEAIIAAKKMKFKPAMKDGKPVRYPVRIEVVFNLR